MDLTAKLQLKAGQDLEAVFAPAPLAADLAAISSTGSPALDPALIVFVIDRAALEAERETISNAAGNDRLTWVAYPKSGQLGTDLNRDSLAATLRTSGLQPVRQIAVDAIWSALRFRPG
jgi:hypothetical protein